MLKKIIRLALDTLVLGMFFGMLVLPFGFFSLSGYRVNNQVLGESSQRDIVTPSQVESFNRIKVKQSTPSVQSSFQESDLRDKR